MELPHVRKRIKTRLLEAIGGAVSSLEVVPVAFVTSNKASLADTLLKRGVINRIHGEFLLFFKDFTDGTHVDTGHKKGSLEGQVGTVPL